MNIAVLEDLNNDFFILKDAIIHSALYAAHDMNITHYQSGEAFMKDFELERFQLLFLDMILDGDMTGMDVAREV